MRLELRIRKLIAAGTCWVGPQTAVSGTAPSGSGPGRIASSIQPLHLSPRCLPRNRSVRIDGRREQREPWVGGQPPRIGQAPHHSRRYASFEAETKRNGPGQPSTSPPVSTASLTVTPGTERRHCQWRALAFVRQRSDSSPAQVTVRQQDICHTDK